MKKLFAALAVLATLTFTAAHAETNIADAMKDRTVGSATAPMTIIEYASMTCSHCAQFNNDVLPIVKKDLIDTGKANYIFRDFPLDQYALKAAVLTRCAPPEKYHDLVDAIYKRQQEWTKNSNPIDGLHKIALEVAGMDSASIGACLGNAAIEEGVLKGMQDAQNFKVQRTPSFFFKKGAEWVGSYPEFTDIVEKNTKHEHEH